MDMLLARHNMMEGQVKPLGVLNPDILAVMGACPREAFVPTAYKNIAYADTSIQLGNGKVLLAPNIIGRMLQALDLKGSEHVLELNTGSGYLTAILAELALHVTGIEPSKALAMQANKTLSAMALTNFEIITGTSMVLQGTKGFDVIVLTGSVAYVPKKFMQHLQYGGKIFAVVGQAPVMHACIFTRINEKEWSEVILFETVIPPLKEIVNVQAFQF